MTEPSRAPRSVREPGWPKPPRMLGTLLYVVGLSQRPGMESRNPCRRPLKPTTRNSHGKRTGLSFDFRIDAAVAQRAIP